jgi:hypothetical protein
MNRDIELVRKILLKIEADPQFDGTFRPVTTAALGIDDCDGDTFAYHCVLLAEAGFITGNMQMANQGMVVIGKLTWSGHEFLDDIRDPEIWRKSKERAKTVAGVGLAFLWEIAKAEIKTKLGLP